jgi:site-specific DNA-methyltransferase (adenine-specific)
MSLHNEALDRITDVALKYNPKDAKKGAQKPPKVLLVEGRYEIVLMDAFKWLAARTENSVHAIVTDPPYGLKEFTDVEQTKMRRGKGGVWRIPPSFDGAKRMGVPRFTILDNSDIAALVLFFEKFAKAALRVLVPGGHVMIATNPLLSQHVYVPMMEAGFEKRGEIIRLVQTLRGGDRPKNAHKEFTGVSVMPRSGWEPWGLFRKPLEGRVQDNLRKWGTGGLRRISGHEPFVDVIRSAPTRGAERAVAPHPSLKPQALMRQLVSAALPLGKGVILDPFMGGGSTIAAARAVGYESIGIEQDPAYFRVADKAIPALARLSTTGASSANGSAGRHSAATKKPTANSHRKGR